MSKSVPERFEAWLLAKGIFRNVMTTTGKAPLPASPMSPKTVRGTINRFKKMMKDLGHMEMEGEGMYSSWSVVQGTDWTKIGVGELEAYLQKKYGDLENINLNSRNNVCKALRKFAQFMHYEFRPRGKPGFSRNKLEKIYQITTLIPVGAKKLVINSPRRAHAFADWLQEQEDPIKQMYGRMVHIGQWFGLRYEEMMNCPANLQGKTVNVDFQRRWCTFWGKGRYGKKERGMPLSRNMGAWCKDLLTWREGQEVDHDKMFFSPRTSNPYNPAEGSTFNRMLRKFAKDYNDQLQDPGLKLDISLVKSHMIMRHIFGSHYGSKLTELKLMDYMGINDHKTVERYINYSDREAIEDFDRINGEKTRTARKEGSSLSENQFSGSLQDLKDRASEIYPEKAGAIVKLLEAIEELAE